MIPGVGASSRRTQSATAPTTPRAKQGNSTFVQAITQTSDWGVSFERMSWYTLDNLPTVLTSGSTWGVSFESAPIFIDSPSAIDVVITASSDWGVSFKRLTRTDDLGFDDQMMSLLPDLYLPMVESVPYSEKFDTVMMSLSPDLFLPMLYQERVIDYSFDDTMVMLGAELFLPMIREDTQ